MLRNESKPSRKTAGWLPHPDARKKKLILRCWYSLGDIVLLTAAVRELHNTRRDSRKVSRMINRRFNVAVLWCVGFLLPCDVAKAQSPSLEYALMSKGWQVYGNLAYRPTLLLGSDGGLIGVSLSLLNISNSKPLKLSRLEVFKVPFYLEITDEKGHQLLPDPPDPQKWPALTKWVLPPRGIRQYFIAVNKLLPEDFEPKGTEKYRVWVNLAAIQQNYDSPVGRDSFSFPNVSITHTSFQLPGEKTFQKAMKAAELPSANQDQVTK